MQAGRLTDTAGTYAFFAPEVCAGEEYNAYKADVWALGITLYAFVHGKLPFWVDGGMQPLFDAIKTQVGGSRNGGMWRDGKPVTRPCVCAWCRNCLCRLTPLRTQRLA